MAVIWHSWCVVDDRPAPSLDALVVELALVREAGLQPLDVEAVIAELPVLGGLGVIQRRTHSDTALARAMTICQIVREAAERLSDDPELVGPPGRRSNIAQAQMLFRVHYSTKQLSPAEARAKTQASSGVADRQYRGRHEARLLRLVAQAVVDR